MFKKMFTLLIAVLFVVPFVVAADDFDDDFGGGFEEDGEDSEEEKEEEEGASEQKQSDEQSESDAAMRDLMGAVETEKPAAKNNAQQNQTNQQAEEEEASGLPKGLKPVLLVKGGFTVMGSHKYAVEGKDSEGNKINTWKNGNAMFGSVDEGILGLEYLGEHVIAKGTVNLRTDNALMENAVTNPLMKANLHSIMDGAANALYEVYGGVKFYDVFIKAGKMIPEYGLIDGYQELGMGFATPFLSRSLIVVEGFIPETDAGLALGYNGTFMEDHNVFAGVSLGTGSINSEFWDSDKTMGIYGRVGYAFRDYLKAAVAFQYRTDFYSYPNDFEYNGKKGKDVNLIGIGVHLKGGYAGFEMPVSFDYNMMKMVKMEKDPETKEFVGAKKKSPSGMLLSLAPGYAYHFDHEWIDKVSIAVRFDFVKGVYLSKNDNYLDFDNFKKGSSYYRIGATANFFTKELAGVRGMAGLTFLMQPKSKVDPDKANKDDKYNHGFTTIVLQAGAEF